MAASDFISTVQGMYVAYYGRFADQAGLTYWSGQLDTANGNLTQIINSFGNSTEANGLFGSLANDAKIEKLYSNLFNHAADTAGKAYYAGLLTAGTATGADIAKRILDGATGTDQVAINSKVVAATNLTNTVSSSLYSGDVAATAARDLIASVTSPAGAAAATAAAFSAAVENVVHPTAAPTTAPVDTGNTDGTIVQPTTKTLTSGADVLPGTSGNDTFLATQDTLTAFDIINGGAGSDKLSIAVSGTGTQLVSGFKTTAVELVEIKSLNAGSVTLDMADVNMVDTNTATATQLLNTQTPVTVASRESADTTLITIKNIQDIGNTNIRVEDTAVAHNFSYDAQANQDNGAEAEVQLIENRATDLNFYKESVSGAANSDITSMKLTSTRDVENAYNDVNDLNVGTKFASLTIVHDAGTVAAPTAATNVSSQTMGDASLRFVTTMDASLVTVDASAHDIAEATAPMFTVTGYDAVAAVAATTRTVASSELNCYVDEPVAATAAVAAPTFALVMDMSAANAAVNFKGSQDSTAITFADNAQTKTIATYGGNDGIIAAAGTNTIDSGAGNDTIVSGTGADTITTGAGNDRVTDAGGNNTVTMGDGNDSLTLLDATSQNAETTGSTTVFTTIDSSVSGATTTTIATKTVTTTPDGLTNRGDNNIDMGAGNDTITMQAKELSVGDTITGGTGTDTLVLQNANSNLAAQTTPVRDGNADNAAWTSWGTVGATETQRTTSIEKYDLRDSHITLDLGNLSFSTADNNSVTVDTTKATGVQTLDLTAVTAPTYQVTLAGGANKDVVIVNDSFFNGMSTLNFGGTVDLGDNATIETSSPDSTNGQTVIDTLRVVTTNGAHIKQADLDKITGLERMEFAACCGTAQNWSVELTDAFLNRITDTRVGCSTTEPTGTDRSSSTNATIGVQGEFVIYVDPNVPAGSHLTIDASKLSAATSWVAADGANTDGTGKVLGADSGNDIKVVVMGNNNVSINVINDTAGRVNVVKTSLDFTSNGDNLVGTDGADVFTATSLNQLNQADNANGGAGVDTLNLGFGVYNAGFAGATAELSNQLENISLNSVETLTFVDTTDAANYGVQFQYTTNHDSVDALGKTDSLMTFNLSGHNDTMSIITNSGAAGANTATVVTAARNDADGRTINTLDGDDTVNVVNSGDVTISGGTGTDTVNGIDTGDVRYSANAIATDVNTITTINVENVNTGLGDDNLVIGGTNTVNVAVNLGAGADFIGLAAGATGTMTVNGGDVATSGQYATTADTLVGSSGADTVVTTDVECIHTEAGNDSITVNNSTAASVTKVVGGAGNDTIALHANTADTFTNFMGTDVVVYGNEYTTAGAGNAHHTQNGASMAVTSGVDTVSGFDTGSYLSTRNDYIDLTGLLGDSMAVGKTVDVQDKNAASGYADLAANAGTAGNANVAIVWNLNATVDQIKAASGNYFFSTTESSLAIAKIENNGEAVIAFTNDVDGDNVASVNLIYVTDTDNGAGQHWVVTDLGTVAFNQGTGLNGGTLDDNFIVGSTAGAAISPTPVTPLDKFVNDGTATTSIYNYEECAPATALTYVNYAAEATSHINAGLHATGTGIALSGATAMSAQDILM